MVDSVTEIALVNGIGSTRVVATDRGLMYGDGLFETFAVCDGFPCLWKAHMNRLRAGADRLRIPCPPESLLWHECRSVIGKALRCVLKLVVTRGSGGRGYSPPAVPRPTRIVSSHPWPEHPEAYYQSGVSVKLCNIRLADQPVLAGIKHLNRLEQVLARSEWTDPDYAEGLMRDSRGRAISGTMSNLFAFAKGRLVTPSLERCGIAGTVRDLVLRTAPHFGIESAEQDLYPSDLLQAEGLFLTNAVIGVWPVRQLGEQRYDVHRLPLEFLERIRAGAHQSNPEFPHACVPY